MASALPVPFKDYQEYYNLGSFQRKVSTDNLETQSWFNAGLVWSYAFNHEEAASCFEQAIANDPTCAIAYWGLAYALGPNYNKPYDAFDEAELALTVERTHHAMARASEYSNEASPVEVALLRALAFRYPQAKTSDSKEFSIWNEAYAKEMESVYESFPDDFDIAALYADALMNLKPWGLFDLKTGLPAAGARTLDIRNVLQKALAQPDGNEHPGLLHLYIHLMEMSSTPEVALDVSARLQGLVPDAGHLNHMPSHIYVLCGDYESAITSNLLATRSDQKFLARSGSLNFYALYRCHNYHFLMYAAMFAGQSKVALEAMNQSESLIPEELLRVQSPPMADWLESFISIRVHILIRFGFWDEILKIEMPKDSKLYCVTTAMIRYGRGIALAVQGDLTGADNERELFGEALKRVPSTRTLFNNKCLNILAIARSMLDGEIDYRKHEFDSAFEHLRTGIALERGLTYDEPHGWMQPVSHAYGALSLEQGHVEEAAASYKADLGLDHSLPRAQQHPNNIWALHGYHECLVRLGRTVEADEIRVQLQAASKKADIPITSSCFCRIESKDLPQVENAGQDSCCVQGEGSSEKPHL